MAITNAALVIIEAFAYFSRNNVSPCPVKGYRKATERHIEMEQKIYNTYLITNYHVGKGLKSPGWSFRAAYAWAFSKAPALAKSSFLMLVFGLGLPETSLIKNINIVDNIFSITCRSLLSSLSARREFYAMSFQWQFFSEFCTEFCSQCHFQYNHNFSSQIPSATSVITLIIILLIIVAIILSIVWHHHHFFINFCIWQS